MPEIKEIKDHEGHAYGTYAEMAKAYSIRPETLAWRIKHGWDIKSALLSGKKRPGKQNRAVFDHNGISYPSIAAMAKIYKIAPATLQRRIAAGWDIKKALTEPLRNEKVLDHLGKEYATIADMLDAYGITYAAYVSRSSKNWGLEKTLTTPLDKRPCKKDRIAGDMFGNEFPSAQDLLRYYSLGGKARKRLARRNISNDELKRSIISCYARKTINGAKIKPLAWPYFEIGDQNGAKVMHVTPLAAMFRRTDSKKIQNENKGEIP